MALLGIKLGKKVIMVVEKLEELRQIITISRQLGVEPLIGIRARLLSQGRGQVGRERRRERQVRPEHRRTAGGHGTAQGGEPGPLLQAAAFPHRLAGAGHSHRQEGGAGGRRAFTPSSTRWAFAIEYLDVGGGLGVDYDGSRSAFDSSTNYTLQEYTNDIVYYIGRRLQRGEGAAPGHHQRKRPGHRRASQRADRRGLRRDREDAAGRASSTYGENEHPLVTELLDIRKNLAKLNKLEAYHDALERKEDAQHMFTLGMMDLPDKAKIENLYWEISQRGRREFQGPGLRAGGNPQARRQPRRPVPLQLLRVPVAAGPLGARASCSPSCPSAG